VRVTPCKAVTTFSSVHGKLGTFHHGRSHHDHKGRPNFGRSARAVVHRLVNPHALSMLETAKLPTKASAARLGMSLQGPERPSSTSSSPSVITQHRKSVRSAGPTMTAHWGVPDPSAVPEHPSRSSEHSERPSSYLTAGSTFCSACRLQASARSRSEGNRQHWKDAPRTQGFTTHKAESLPDGLSPERGMPQTRTFRWPLLGKNCERNQVGQHLPETPYRDGACGVF